MDSTLKASYRGATVLNESPLVAVIDDVIDAEACRQCIEASGESMRRARVSLDDESAVIPGRTGSNTWLRYDKYPIARTIGDQISTLVGIPLDNAESIQVIHYGKEQKYGAHYDAYDLSSPRGQRCCKYGGQRLLTCLVYLNDVAGGGATRFPKLDLEVSPKAGRMVIFHNVDPSDYSRPHPKSLHGGEPIEAGEKWAMNIWFRQASTRKVFAFDPPSATPGV